MAQNPAALSIADAALASASWRDVGIRGIIEVSLRTVSLGLVGTPKATEDATRDIHRMGYNPQVIGVDAGSVTADVVEFEAGWDGVPETLVGPAMGQEHTVGSIPVSGKEHAVATGIPEGSPQPTRIGLLNLGKESLLDGSAPERLLVHSDTSSPRHTNTMGTEDQAAEPSDYSATKMRGGPSCHTSDLP